MDRQAIDVKRALVGRQPYVLLHICLFTCLVGETRHGAREIVELCNKEASRLCHYGYFSLLALICITSSSEGAFRLEIIACVKIYPIGMEVCFKPRSRPFSS
jgi:hypothetical protein